MNTPHQYNSGDKIKEDEMGRACDTHEEEEKCTQGFGVEAWMKETNWKA
jgi:hypothetical protein